MLTTDQMAHLEDAERNVRDKALILNTAIDVQAMLRFLVDKEIITKEEVQKYRDEVRKSPKYASAMLYIDQTLAEIDKYKADPQALLSEMFKRKMEGK